MTSPYVKVAKIAQIQLAPSDAETYIPAKCIIALAQKCLELDKTNIQFSLTKETKDHGNTSVSMGCAVTTQKPIVLCLNVGSNGTKYQLYQRTETGYTALKELKPMKDALNFHNLENDVKLLELETQAYVAKCKVPFENVVVFITGTLREKWEQGNPEQRADLERRAHEVFGNIGQAAVEGYYLSQTLEAAWEYLAAVTMHTSMGVEPPNVTFGVGGKSAQMTIVNDEKQAPTTLLFKHGMNDGTAFEREFMAKLDEIVEALPDAHIALKSGFLLYKPFVDAASK